MSSPNEKNLVKSAKNGDAEAFGELYALYARDMYRFAYYYLGSSSLAEDAVSSAVTIAFEKIGQLKKTESFKAWQFKILRNCCAESQREKSVAVRLVSIHEMNTQPASETDMNLAPLLSAAMLGLSENEREVVLLHFVSGYQSREIAKMTGEKEGTIRSRISRACQKMRDYIGKEEF